MSLKNKILSWVLIGIGMMGIAQNAFAQNSPFKVLSNNITPSLSSWTLTLPYLGTGSTLCVTASATGLLGTTACGGAGGSWATTSENYYWSLFRDLSVQGNGYLAPTTTRGFIFMASSTASNLTVTNGTTTNATSTNIKTNTITVGTESGCASFAAGLLTGTGVACGSGSGSWATTSQDYYFSQFRDWSLQGSPLFLAPTTSRAILVNNSTSTITNLLVVNGTTTNSTSTLLYVSSKLGVATTSPSMPLSVTGNALISGTVYAANFYDTALSGNACIGETGGLLGQDTNCVSSIASAASTLTVSSPTGNVNLELNLAKANVWTASTTFTGGLTAINATNTNATSTNLYVSGTTRLASLSGLLKGTTGVVSTGVNGTDYTLVTAKTCTGTDKFSAVTADGTFTCTTDSSGGGSGGGSWSTTTSQVAGQLINYPNNTTDIVTIGSNSTTTAEYWFDPNTQITYLSGKVGIGTTTPETDLDVSTNGLTTQIWSVNQNPLGAAKLATINDVSNGGTITSIGSGTSNSGFTSLANSTRVDSYGGDLVIGAQTSNHIRFFTNGTSFTSERMRITSAGLVGIGTTTPGRLFSVHGDALISNTLYTANLTATGTITFRGKSDGCASFTSEVLSSTGVACGSGSGGGNSKWATTTNNLDITTNGGGGIILSASSTIDKLSNRLGTTTNATSTNLYVSGDFWLNAERFNDLTGAGMANINGTLTFNGSSLFRDWSIQGSPIYLAPTTTIGILVNSSTSTITNLLTINGTTTNATSTAFSVVNTTATGSTTLQNFTAKQSTSTQATTTNMFSTTASSTNLFSQIAAFGSLSLQTALPASSGGTGATSLSNSFSVVSNVFSGVSYFTFTVATTTAWSGTTTIPLGPAFVAETWNGIMCFTNTGTLNVNVYYGTGPTQMAMFNASTTVGTVSWTTNNTPAATNSRKVDIGTPASSPQSISCTVKKTI